MSAADSYCFPRPQRPNQQAKLAKDAARRASLLSVMGLTEETVKTPGNQKTFKVEMRKVMAEENRLETLAQQLFPKISCQSKEIYEKGCQACPYCRESLEQEKLPPQVPQTWECTNPACNTTPRPQLQRTKMANENIYTCPDCKAVKIVCKCT